MQNVKIKVVGYEEASGSLLVCFASDVTASINPEDYQPVAFQPAQMWPDTQSIEEIKLRLAKAGAVIAEQQALKEALNTQPERVAALQTLVGVGFEYPVSALVDPVTEVTPLLVV